MESLALVEAGFDVAVICPQSEPGQAERVDLDGVRIYTYFPPPQASGVAGFVREFAYCWVKSARLSLRAWREGRFHALQACNPPDTYWLLALLWRIRGVRFVYDQHDLCPEVYEARFHRRGPLWVALRLLERATYATAHHVISTNESYREVAASRGGVRSVGSSIVRSAPDPGRMRPVAPDASLRGGFSYLACYLGIMGPQDGVDRLLDAIAVYVHTLGRRDCRFALLGFGDCLEDLRRQATRLGLDDVVIFAGRADPAMIEHWLSSADIGLAPDPPSTFNDKSTMNKVLEYMAYRLPVVSFDLTENRRSAQDAARIVDRDDDRAFAEAIAELLNDPQRRADMGRAGRSRIEGAMNWEHQARTYVGVYDMLLRHGSPAAATPEVTPARRAS